MGKKVKKLAQPFGGNKKGLPGLLNRIDPLGGYITNELVDPMLGQSGLPNVSGRNAAREQAEEQARLTRQQNDEQQRMLQTMQNNMQADLKSDNLSNVVAGGSADAFEGTDPTKRRRRTGGLTAALQV